MISPIQSLISQTQYLVRQALARGIGLSNVSQALAVAIACTLIFLPPSACFASDIDDTATLASAQLNRPTPIVIRPAPNQPITGYGISGQSIVVLEEIGDILDFTNDNATWCHIRLEDKPFTEGWIQKEFIDLSPNKS